MKRFPKTKKDKHMPEWVASGSDYAGQFPLLINTRKAPHLLNNRQYSRYGVRLDLDTCPSVAIGVYLRGEFIGRVCPRFDNEFVPYPHPMKSMDGVHRDSLSAAVLSLVFVYKERSD